MSFALAETAGRATLARRLDGAAIAGAGPSAGAGSVLSAARSRRPGQARANAGQETPRERPVSDFYCTPWHATRAGLAAFGALLPEGPIEEPCAGRGDIVKVLREPGHALSGRRVIAADLNDWAPAPEFGIAVGVNFLRRQRRLGASTIITNPPYSQIDAFILHADGLGFDAVALFCRLGALAGQTRLDVLRGARMGDEAPAALAPWCGLPRRLGLEAVWVSAERVTMYPGLDVAAEVAAQGKRDGAGGLDSGSAMDTAWLLLSRRGKAMADDALRRAGSSASGEAYPWWRGGIISTRKFWRPEDGRALLPINLAGLK